MDIRTAMAQKVQPDHSICCLHTLCMDPVTELQIRGGIKDNSKIIFLIYQEKHML